MSTVIVVLVVSVLVLGVVFLYRFKKAPMVENDQNILVLTDQNFAESIKNRLVLVDFWAEWCMPCKIMAPILNELSNELPEGQYVGKVDVEKYQKLSQKYSIKNIPTLILFKNGKEVKRIVGVKQKGFLKDVMKRAL